MDFIIAIPSYKRHKTIKNKTLKLLKENNVSNEIIYIFVADQNEYEIYLNEIGKDYKIIIGKHTLKEQRNFINDFFELRQKIICLDDDLESLIYGYKKEKEIIKSEIPNIMDIFKKGFEDLAEYNAFLFGFYPVSNLFFMSDKLSINNQYIIGSAYGFINRKIKVNTEDKEDVERSLQHYVKDGKTLRYNYISFKTKYYTEKGGMQEKRTLQSIKEGAEYINRLYPDLTKIKIKKNGRYEIVFVKEKKIDEKIKRFKIDNKNKIYIEEIKNKLDNLLLPTIKLDSGRGIPERGDKLLDSETIKLFKEYKSKKGDKNVARTLNIGFGRRRRLSYGILMPTNKKKYNDLFIKLVELGKKITPKNMSFNAITINQNIKCKKHKDPNNVGESVFFTIGDFTGGGIYVENKLYKNCNEYITIFNGAEKEHYTEEFIGNRYSFIFYNAYLDKCPPEFIYKGEF